MMAHYIQKGNYDATELDGEWIILNTDQYTISKLNNVGGYCWTLLKEVQTVDSLLKLVTKRFTYSANEQQVKEDLEDFLVNLLQCELIQYVD
jgi:hypothetical protein